MTTPQAEQILVERLADQALVSAAGGTLTREHIDELARALRSASAAGVSASRVRELQDRIGGVLDVREASRTATALKADSYGRRRAVRITSPPLTVSFADGQVCCTVDWSTYGILVSGFHGGPLVGEQITADVRSADVEGGGAVIGWVVLYSAASGQLAIEFLRRSLSVQVMKVRMLRSGLL